MSVQSAMQEVQASKKINHQKFQNDEVQM